MANSRFRYSGSSSWEQRFSDHCESSSTLDDDDGDEIDSDDDTDLNAAKASSLFLSLLIYLKMTGKLSAKHVCILSFYAQAAGLTGEGGNLAMPPNRTGGNYSAHFDKQTGMAGNLSKDVYNLDMATRQKWALGRSVTNFPIALFHLFLIEQVASIQDFWGKLKEAAKTSFWGRRWASHPVTAADPEKRVVPFALYSDGVDYGKRSHQTGFWMYNLLTKQRILICTLRKV